jgi:hypothetical protein
MVGPLLPRTVGAGQRAVCVACTVVRARSAVRHLTAAAGWLRVSARRWNDSGRRGVAGGRFTVEPTRFGESECFMRSVWTGRPADVLILGPLGKGAGLDDVDMILCSLRYKPGSRGGKDALRITNTDWTVHEVMLAPCNRVVVDRLRDHGDGNALDKKCVDVLALAEGVRLAELAAATEPHPGSGRCDGDVLITEKSRRCMVRHDRGVMLDDAGGGVARHDEGGTF